MSYQPGAVAQIQPLPLETILSYVEFTSNVTVSGTNEATANTVVTAATFVADGTSQYLVEFFSPFINTGASDQITVVLLEAATVIAGQWGNWFSPGAGTFGSPALLRIKLTPAAGPRQYIVKAFRTTNNGLVVAGTGGTGVRPAGYIMITKAG